MPNLLVVNADMSDDMAFAITKALYDNKAKLAEIVPSAESLDPAAGQEVVEPVRLHPGARRYYQEQGG